MQVRANIEGIGIGATIETAGLAKDTMVTITGDATVDIATAADIVVGHISVPVKDVLEEDGQGTIETKYKRLFNAKFVAGAIAAGVEVQAGEQESGVSTVKALGADSRALCVGIVWIGAADDATGTVLGY